MNPAAAAGVSVKTRARLNVILPSNTMSSRDADTIQAVLNGNSDRFAELVVPPQIFFDEQLAVPA